MELVLVVVGGLLALVGWIWILINAFSDSIIWGVASFCFSPIALVYGFLHWADLKVPTVMLAIGMILSGVGQAMKG